MLFHLKLRHLCDSLVGEKWEGSEEAHEANSEAVAKRPREKQCGDSEGDTHSDGFMFKCQ